MKRILISIVCAIVLSTSSFLPPCSPPKAAGGTLPPATVDPTSRLRADLDRIFSDPSFSNARWGIKIFSLERSETLYEKDATRLFVPASNNKIITTAVALIRLGPDYRYETRLMTDGQIQDGVLRGNLVIVGTGDPLDSPQLQPIDPFLTFRSWANKLKGLGITKINGDLLGDSSAFEETKHGQGWEWNDLAQGYAAPVTALQFHDNMLELKISPATQKGDPASVKMLPLAAYLAMENRIRTDTEGTPSRIKVGRSPFNETVVLTGSIPLKGAQAMRTISVPSPVHYFLSAVKMVLDEEGIDAGACGIREASSSGFLNLSPLWTHYSPPLSELLKPLVKTSHNLFAETLTRTLGLSLRGDGSFAAGKEVIEETLEQMGIEKNSYVYADGSGLSRLNLTSPHILVRVLQSIYAHPRFKDFYDALAIAGADGTLAARMKNTKAAKNVRAKTGSIANVSAISGYVQTAEGEMLAFSILANNFLAPREKVERMQDMALERLAVFSRK